MPRSVIVLSKDPNLAENVGARPRSDSRFVVTDEGVHCDGSSAPLTNIYPTEMIPTEWDGWTSEEREMPDPTTMSALIFECRSPSWVAEVGAMLAQDLKNPLWFVDSSDKAWPAARIDPERISLS